MSTATKNPDVEDFKCKDLEVLEPSKPKPCPMCRGNPGDDSHKYGHCPGENHALLAYISLQQARLNETNLNCAKLEQRVKALEGKRPWWKFSKSR